MERDLRLEQLKDNDPKQFELIGTKRDAQIEAYKMFYMSMEDRVRLGKVLGFEGPNVSVEYNEAEQIAERSFDATRAKLEGIGLTVPQYYAAFQALESVDLDTIRDLKGISRRRMAEDRDGYEGRTTKQVHSDPVTGRYNPTRLYFHHKIVEEKLHGLKQKEHPEIVFLVGAPGTGKTSLRNEMLGRIPRYAVTDPDSMREVVLPNFDATRGEDVYHTQEEVFDLATEVLDEAVRRRVDAVCETTLRNTDWVMDIMKQAKDYRFRMVLLHTPLHECFKRAVAWRSRAASIDFLLTAVSGYDNFLTLAKLGALGDNGSFKILDTDLKTGQRKLIFDQEGNEVLLNDQERVDEIQRYAHGFKQVALYE